MHKHLQYSDSILVLGPGTSALHEQLYERCATCTVWLMKQSSSRGCSINSHSHANTTVPAAVAGAAGAVAVVLLLFSA